MPFIFYNMSRPLRITYPGAFYHITSRGNEKNDIFFCDDDRRTFLRLLGLVVREYHWVCHAYVLMGNHYHLLVETPDANLSQGMRQLNGMYTQRVNERHDRVGHIFQGRFKAFLVENEVYFLTVARYIVLNPVRAGIVRNVREYEWSSYLSTVGAIPKKTFLTVSSILSRFSLKAIQSQKMYARFILDGYGKQSPFQDVKNGILGSDQFVLLIHEAQNGQIKNAEIPKAERILGRPLLQDVFANAKTKTARDSLIHVAVLICGYSFSDVARYLSLHYSRVSRIFREVEKAQGKT